jgi:hypothetical protein
MGVTFLCQGCGTRTAVPDDYQRKKMQCPACGVMCEVPAAAPKKGPDKRPSRRAVEPPPAPAGIGWDEERPVATSIPAASASPPPIAEPPPAVPPPTQPAVVPCPQCRQPVQVPADLGGLQVRCPRCGVVVAEPAAWGTAGARPRPPAAANAGLVFADEDDGQPYAVTGGEKRPCPECKRTLAPDARVCDQCGFNLETGRKPPDKVHEPLERHWEAGLPFARRLRLFFILEAVLVGVGLVGVILGAPLAAFVMSCLFIASLLLFLLGTYDRIDLERNRRGRVRLTKTWRVCFRTWSTESVPWRECDSIATGTTFEVDVWDWVLLLTLLSFFCIPGFVWWYLMHKVSYFVALTKDHGYPAVALYKGWSEEHMQEMVRTLHEVTGLPLEGG